MRFPQGWELVLVLAVVVLLFGTKKLPDAARGLGRSLRIFKSEIKTMQDEDKPSTTATPAAPSAITPPAEGPTRPAEPPVEPSTPQVPPRAEG